MTFCFTCRQSKFDTEFHRDRSHKSGRSRVCRPCHKDYLVQRRRAIRQGIWVVTSPQERYEQALVKYRSLAPVELGWIAGFLDGDGCFSPGASTQMVTAAQVDPESLYRLQTDVGGTVSRKRTIHPGAHNKSPLSVWCISGPRARALMKVIRLHMSSRRQAQIDRALSSFRAAIEAEVVSAE